MKYYSDGKEGINIRDFATSTIYGYDNNVTFDLLKLNLAGSVISNKELKFLTPNK